MNFRLEGAGYAHIPLKPLSVSLSQKIVFIQKMYLKCTYIVQKINISKSNNKNIFFFKHGKTESELNVSEHLN